MTISLSLREFKNQIRGFKNQVDKDIYKSNTSYCCSDTFCNTCRRNSSLWMHTQFNPNDNKSGYNFGNKEVTNH